MKTPTKILALALLCVAPLCATDQAPTRWEESPLWGDQGLGIVKSPDASGQTFRYTGRQAVLRF